MIPSHQIAHARCTLLRGSRSHRATEQPSSAVIQKRWQLKFLPASHARSLQQPALESSHLAALQASQFLRLPRESNRCLSRRSEISAPSKNVSRRKDTEWIELVLYCSHHAQLQSRHLKGEPA